MVNPWRKHTFALALVLCVCLCVWVEEVGLWKTGKDSAMHIQHWQQNKNTILMYTHVNI